MVESPEQTGFVLAVTEEGATEFEFTVMAVVAVPVQPFPSVTVTA